jgi:hypothetical protein
MCVAAPAPAFSFFWGEFLHCRDRFFGKNLEFKKFKKIGKNSPNFLNHKIGGK